MDKNEKRTCRACKAQAQKKENLLFLCLCLCLFYARSHKIFLMLMLLLVLIAQVGTRLEGKVSTSHQIVSYRERLGHENILSSLAGKITTSHTIYPCFGTGEYFEFVLRNAYSTDQNITIHCEDKELR